MNTPIVLGEMQYPDYDKYSPIYDKEHDTFLFMEGFVFGYRIEHLSLLKEFLNNKVHENIVILEGYIPAFTRYARDCNNSVCFCARRMFLSKIIYSNCDISYEKINTRACYKKRVE